MLCLVFNKQIKSNSTFRKRTIQVKLYDEEKGQDEWKWQGR